MNNDALAPPLRYSSGQTIAHLHPSRQKNRAHACLQSNLAPLIGLHLSRRMRGACTKREASRKISHSLEGLVLHAHHGILLEESA
ncbi:hypothetical protein HYQ44_017149 [Verticillium longisporum]|nr:hypothetical protein HYQ44_017149 [Verticillium longisporum]